MRVTTRFAAGGRLQGEKEIIKLLKDIGIEANNILDLAATKGAEVVLEEARKLAPVSVDGQKYGKHRHAPGNLRDSLKVRKPRSNTKRTKRKATATVGMDHKLAFYAPYVELGTKKMKARPFLRPAIDRHKKRISQAVSDEIDKKIRGVM